VRGFLIAMSVPLSLTSVMSETRPTQSASRVTRASRTPFHICQVIGLVLIAGALRAWGAAEVRADSSEIFLFTAVGWVWMLLASAAFPWLGLSLREDAVERKNPAAMAALSGAVLAVAICFAGGHLGEGETWWTNCFSFLLSTAGLLFLWLILECLARPSVAIAEERDLASGVRLAGFLLASSLILSRAVAGDWHSTASTVQDFLRDGWPAALVGVVAVKTEISFRPRFDRPSSRLLTGGIIPAGGYIILAALWLIHAGPWEGMPR
jgi:hypothetical protein